MSAATAGHGAPLPRWIDFGVLPLLNVLLALAVAGALVALLGHSPAQAMRLLVEGAFGSGLAWGYTLHYTTNFIFTGLAVALAAHAGLFNIGAEGQASVGGLLACVVALALDRWLPGWAVVLLAMPAAAVGGAAWAAVPAWLQARRGSHIVITTIMFNFIASALLYYLLVNHLKEPGNMAVESAAFGPSAHMPGAHEVLAALGIEWPRTPLNLSVLLAVACAVGTWLLLWKSRTGYELRAVGHAPDAAHYAGIRPKRQVMLAMLISGGLAGLVGINELAGVQGRLLPDFVVGAGFTGIAVSLIGRNHPVGIVLASLLFGALYQGGAELAFEIPGFSRDMVATLQGLIVLFSGAMAMVAAPALARLYAVAAKKKAPAAAAGAAHG